MVRQVTDVLLARLAPDEPPPDPRQLAPGRPDLPPLWVGRDPGGSEGPDEHLQTEADALLLSQVRGKDGRWEVKEGAAPQ